MPNLSKVIEGLNQKQSEAASRLAGETLVIAGAGSGKTAVLTRRCAFLIISGEDPGSILCLTFTNKAAREMNERVQKLLKQLNTDVQYSPSWSSNYTNPLLCTFHSLGVRLIREFGTSIGIASNFGILDRDDQEKIVKNILKEKNIDPKLIPPNACLSFISNCKQELLDAEHSYDLGREVMDEYHRVYRAYELFLINNNSVDFDDLIFRTYTLLKEDKVAREIIQNRWRHIMVDEFQDTNNAQFNILKLLYPND
jgi:DNA helicase II / ATP-dependent DNA helicase PcrA